MTDLDALAAFVLARIAEEEAAARAAYRPGGDGPWIVDVSPSGRASVWQRRPAREVGSSLPPESHLAPVVATLADNARAVCEHIARQSPAVTLARVQALRSLVELHGRVEEHGEAMCGHCARPGEISGDLEGDWPCATLRLLASIYRYRSDGSQHPDWQETWAA